MLLIDTNVQLGLTTNNRKWSHWSLAKLKEVSTLGPLLINDVVHAELSVGFGRIEDLDRFLDDTRVDIAPTPRPALLQTAKTIRQYRKNGGNKTGVVTDFFVGAHAVVENLPLLTRGPRRYRTYFPMLMLITPE
ncbi:MAG: PIN domain-containing protein [Phyllobacterium sp.]|uniref:type II toxin-antitoxin system VapC family toxin n=1 Tax=Phyllobacterium sp. TaxID=1871046 RepID=UPI0030F27FB4